MNGAPDQDIAVFTEALRLPPDERDRHLNEACKGDAEFRLRVEALLQAYEQVLTLSGESSRFGGLNLSLDGRYLLAINDASLAHLWTAPTWEEIAAEEAQALASPGQDGQEHAELKQP